MESDPKRLIALFLVKKAAKIKTYNISEINPPTKNIYPTTWNTGWFLLGFKIKSYAVKRTVLPVNPPVGVKEIKSTNKDKAVTKVNNEVKISINHFACNWFLYSFLDFSSIVKVLLKNECKTKFCNIFYFWWI